MYNILCIKGKHLLVKLVNNIIKNVCEPQKHVNLRYITFIVRVVRLFMMKRINGWMNRQSKYYIAPVLIKNGSEREVLSFQLARFQKQLNPLLPQRFFLKSAKLTLQFIRLKIFI